MVGELLYDDIRRYSTPLDRLARPSCDRGRLSIVIVHDSRTCSRESNEIVSCFLGTSDHDNEASQSLSMISTDTDVQNSAQSDEREAVATSITSE
jgi:hypothetical protein